MEFPAHRSVFSVVIFIFKELFIEWILLEIVIKNFEITAKFTSSIPSGSYSKDYRNIKKRLIGHSRPYIPEKITHISLYIVLNCTISFTTLLLRVSCALKNKTKIRNKKRQRIVRFSRFLSRWRLSSGTKCNGANCLFHSRENTFSDFSPRIILVLVAATGIH